MQVKSKAILSFLLPAILLCCKKDQAPPNQSSSTSCNCAGSYHPNIDTFLIKNFIFNSGTYWVFQDSVNNISDSVYSSGKTSNVGGYWNGGPSCSCYWSARYCMNNNSNSVNHYNYYVVGNSLKQYYSYGPGEEVLINSQNNALLTSSRVNFIGNYTLGSLSFDSVYMCKFVPTINSWAEPDSGDVYLRARVGLIRQEIYEAGVLSVYNLLRYNIQ